MLTWGFASLKPALAKALTTAISFLIERSGLPLMMVGADCRVASAMTACKAAGVSVTGGLTAWVSTLVVSVVVVLVRVMMQIHAHVDRPQSATDWGGLACRSSLIGPPNSGCVEASHACHAHRPSVEKS